VSTVPPDSSTKAPDEAEQTYCYRHGDTPTKLRCSRCERPICGRCAIPASVGQHCPECVADARKSTPRVKSALQASAPVVMGIIITCVVVYVLQLSSARVTNEFVMDPNLVRQGEWWRLFTAMFLHTPNSFLHILFNMYVLYIYGPQVEQVFGHARFAVLYVGAGLAGSAGSYAFGSCIGSVGASGAIFGVVGVLLVHYYNRRQTQAANSLLVFIGINLMLGFFVFPNIDNAAHLGGLVGGLALGYGFDNGGRFATPARQLLTLVVVGGAILALIVWRTANPACNPFGF
jgi:membrane associated rhomboid family serine protease